MVCAVASSHFWGLARHELRVTSGQTELDC